MLFHKNDALQAFQTFYAREQNLSDKRIKFLRTDNGTEYFAISNFCKEKGISHQTTAPYAKEQAGAGERINLTLLNKIRAMLFTAKLNKKFWAEALLAAVYIYNRTPHSAINYKTPYELKFNKKSTLQNIRVWGSITYVKSYNVKKLDPRSKPGILIGYGSNQYKVFDLLTKRVIIARDVDIFENKFLHHVKSSAFSNNDLLQKDAVYDVFADENAKLVNADIADAKNANAKADIASAKTATAKTATAKAQIADANARLANTTSADNNAKAASNFLNALRIDESEECNSFATSLQSNQTDIQIDKSSNHKDVQIDKSTSSDDMQIDELEHIDHNDDNDIDQSSDQSSYSSTEDHYENQAENAANYDDDLSEDELALSTFHNCNYDEPKSYKQAMNSINAKE